MVTLTVLESPHGQLWPPQGSHATPQLESDYGVDGYVWLIARPDADSVFQYFLIDGVQVPEQFIEPDGDFTYHLPIDSDHIVQAVFVQVIPPTPSGYSALTLAVAFGAGAIIGGFLFK